MAARTASSAYSAYRSAEVETLNQRDLIVKLYEGAERFLNQACVAMQARQIEEAHHRCTKAKAIFIELLSTLNLEQGGEIAQRLRALYSFFLDQITLANTSKDPASIIAILPVIATLREGWQQVPEEDANVSSLEGNQGHALNVMS